MLLFIMILGGVITSVVTAGKGRNALGWFFIGALFPLPGVIIACTLKPELEVPPQAS